MPLGGQCSMSNSLPGLVLPSADLLHSCASCAVDAERRTPARTASTWATWAGAGELGDSLDRAAGQGPCKGAAKP